MNIGMGGISSYHLIKWVFEFVARKTDDTFFLYRCTLPREAQLFFYAGT